MSTKVDKESVASGVIFGRIIVPPNERRFVDIDWKNDAGESLVTPTEEGFFLGPKHNKVTNLGLEMLGKREWNITGGGTTAGSTPAKANGLGVDDLTRTTLSSLETMTQYNTTGTNNATRLLDSVPSIDVTTANNPFIDSTSTFKDLTSDATSGVNFIMRSIVVHNRTVNDRAITSSTNNFVYSVISNFTVDLTNITTWTWIPTYRAKWSSA